MPNQLGLFRNLECGAFPPVSHGKRRKSTALTKLTENAALHIPGLGKRFTPHRHEPRTGLSADSQDLAGFGYRTELDRTLGSFSSFAAGFSYLSILTGMFQMFYLGYGAGGPAFFWTWPIVFAGQFLVALCFAELAAHYPLAGGVYQWSKHIGCGAVGWMAGWIYLASLVISISAVALALQITLPQISAWFQFFGATDGTVSANDQARNAVLLGCILIGLTTLINAVGVKLLARINNVGVFAELTGAVLLIILLAAHGRRGPEAVLHTNGLGAGQPFGYLGPFLAAALMASYVMYGFDTAGSLAEETSDPRRRAPRAIVRALAAAAGLGALLMLTALMAAENLADPKLGSAEGGLPFIVTHALGTGIGKVFLWDVIFAISVCTLAVQTSTVRLMFAMARDHNLPFSSALARVSTRSRTPIVPAVLAGVLAAAILVINIDLPHFVDLIVRAAILWANLAYLFVTGPMLYRRWRSWPGEPMSGRFSLGRWGILVNVLAVLWGVLMVINIGWPRADEPDVAWYARGGVILFTAVLLGSGGLYYYFVQRHKTGVLAEHRPVNFPRPCSVRK